VSAGTAFEKCNRAFNDALAIELLNAPIMDDVLIALDPIGWKLVRPGRRALAHALAAPLGVGLVRELWRSRRRPSGPVGA
jgi:hypothetical protein